MLKNSKVFTSFSVDNPEKARDFYGRVLGLTVKEAPQMNGLLELHHGGGEPVMIYPKDDHVPATYTVLNFPVPDIDQAVDALTRMGVAFEHYDAPEIRTDEAGISRGPDYALAWFKDPAGNILSIVENKAQGKDAELVMAGEAGSSGP